MSLNVPDLVRNGPPMVMGMRYRNPNFGKPNRVVERLAEWITANYPVTEEDARTIAARFHAAYSIVSFTQYTNYIRAHFYRVLGANQPRDGRGRFLSHQKLNWAPFRRGKLQAEVDSMKVDRLRTPDNWRYHKGQNLHMK